MVNKIYVVTASANKGQNRIICKALYGGILGSDIKKTAQAMLEEEYQDIKMHGDKIPRKIFKIVEYSDNAELLKQIEQLQEENATLKSNLGECEVNYSAALHYAREDNKKLQAENATMHVYEKQTKKALELACYDIARCYHPNGDWENLKNEYYREYIAKAKKGE